MVRVFKLSVAVVFLGLALSPGISSTQSKIPAPTITVYKTPT